MAKLLIEVKLSREDLPEILCADYFVTMFEDIDEGYIEATVSATVTDDNGEIIEESE